MIDAVGYCRCSTDKQDESISIQKQEITKYATKHGYKIVRWYVDEGIDGHDESRPGFCQMFKDTEGGTWRFVIVRNQARFGRFRPATMARYLDELDRYGVQLVTTNKGIIDVDDLGDFIVSNVEAAGDNKYSKDLSANTIRGQAEKAKNGYSAGQLAPFGYDRMYVDETGTPRQRVKNGEQFAKPKTWRVVFVPSDDPELIELIQWVFDSYVQGTGYASIAAELNRRNIAAPKGGLWHQGTIRAMLKNRIYCGDYRWNHTRQGKFHSRQGGETRPRRRSETAPDKQGRRKHRVYLNDESDWIVSVDAHKPIIDRETWDRAQEIMAANTVHQNSGRPPVDDQHYLLKGLCYCSDCGHKMHGTKIKRKKKGKTYIYRKYICSGYSCKGVCRHNAAHADKLHETVVEEVIKALRHPKRVELIRQAMERQSQVEPPDNSEKIARLEAKLARITKELGTQITRLGQVPDELVETVIKKSSELKAEQSRLEEELESARQVVVEEAPQWTADDVVELLNTVAENLEQCPPEKLQAALQGLIERIELDFEPVPYGKKTIQRLSGGKIHLRKVVGIGMAGTGFEPATSRL